MYKKKKVEENIVDGKITDKTEQPQKKRIIIQMMAWVKCPMLLLKKLVETITGNYCTEDENLSLPEKEYN